MDWHRAGSLLGRAAAGLAGAWLIVGAGLMTWSIVDRADSPVEAVTPTVVAVAIAGLVLASAGSVVLIVGRNADIVVLSAVSVVLVVLTVLSLFSIGVLILPVAIGAVYWLARGTRGRQGLTLALLAGPAMAIGLSVLFFIWQQPSLVICDSDGARTTSRPWWNTGSGSGESSGSASTGTSGQGAVTGELDTPSGRYRFRCDGFELTEFRRVDAR